MNKTLDEFMKDVKKVKEPRKHRFMNSCVGDFYRYFMKIRPSGKEYKIGRPMYQKILARANQMLADHLLENSHLSLLYIGNIYLHKYKTEPKIENGELVYNAPVDWKKTYEMWYEYGKDGLVKHENRDGWFYRYMFKPHRLYINSNLFSFQAARTLKKRVSDKIKNNKVEAFLDTKKWKDS